MTGHVDEFDTRIVKLELRHVRRYELLMSVVVAELTWPHHDHITTFRLLPGGVPPFR